MKKLSLAFVLSALFLMSSCSDKSGSGISGTVENGSGVVYVSLVSATELKPLDTLTLDENGGFSFDPTETGPNFYFIETTDQFRVPVFKQDGEKIKLNITGAEKDRNYTVEGSEESARILDIDAILRRTYVTIDSIDKLNLQYRDSANFMQKRMEFDGAFQTAVKQAQGEMKALIDENPGSISNLFVFSKTIGNFPLVSPQEDMPYFEKVADALEISYPGNEHVTNFRDRLNKLKESEVIRKELEAAKAALKPGNDVPDISLADVDGNTRNLSDLKGKVVLVDFWASWCTPCRRENPNLVRMYNEYKDLGFDIYSVSLDGLPQQPNPRQVWTGAIEQDGLTWSNHVSDLKGWSSSVVRTFGFQGIPFTVLVDRDGKILATELRGPALEQKLKETLGV